MPTPQLAGRLVGEVAAVNPGRHDRPVGFAAGFAAGFAEGLRQASERAVTDERARLDRDCAAAAARHAVTERAAAGLVAAAARLAEVPDGIVDSIADTLADEVVTLAEAVLDAELSEPGLRAATALRRALSAVSDQVAVAERVTVRMHPDDAAALDPAALRGVVIVTDASLHPGDATAVGGSRWVDARLRQTLARVRQAMSE